MQFFCEIFAIISLFTLSLFANKTIFTAGHANPNIATHVRALMPLKSERTPAAIAPTIPPMSNRIDNVALAVAPYEATKKSKRIIR